MRRPGLFARLGLAERYERDLAEIVIEALQELSDKDPGESEPSLNRKLYRSVIDIYHRRRKRGEYAPDFAPAFDAPNPPLAYEFSPSENKRPDLRWDLVDHLTASVQSFAVECKRLRSKSDAGWRFNRSYALHGVARFAALEHQYGANMASGAMVGYWQNMTRSAVLAEINDALDSIGLPRIEFGGDSPGHLSRADQTLNRPFGKSPYRLQHLWLDMRNGEALTEAETAHLQHESDEAEHATRVAEPETATEGLGEAGGEPAAS